MIGSFAQSLFLLANASLICDAFRETPPFGRQRLLQHRISLNDASLLPFQECWSSDAVSVNPTNDTRIETLLQRLCSPAPQSYFIARRFLNMSQDKNDLPNESTFSEIEYLLKPGYRWDYNAGYIEIIPADKRQSNSVLPSLRKTWSVLELSHEALRVASESDGDERNKYLQKLVKNAKERLQVTLGTDVRGRSSADAAFSFALAGIDDEELYDMLATITCKELERVGKRPSFKSKYILQIIEKLAAAGLRNANVHNLHLVAAECLESKGEHLDVVKILRNEEKSFDLLSVRALLWIWRFSSRQSKIKSTQLTEEQQKASSPSWVEAFDDSSRPLVVDFGCGMGVSLLGLATIDEDSDYVDGLFLLSKEDLLTNFTRWREANYLGCDLSPLATGYAQGIANRWSIQERVQFVCGSGHDVLDEIKSNYPGEVVLALVQFPSPFQYKGKGVGGNSQLPVGLEDGFLASSKLFHRLTPWLRSSGGTLLLQSNVEDVAVAMQNAAIKSGFESSSIPQHQSIELLSKPDVRLPQRTEDWIRSGGERAIGKTWSSVPLLPSRAATETEVSCDFLGTPVHRCLLRARN